MTKKSFKISYLSALLILVIAILGGSFGSFLFLKMENVPRQISREIITPAKGEESEKKVIFVEESSIISAAEEVSPAVVSIIISKDLPKFRQHPFFFDPNQFFDDPFFDDPFYDPFSDFRIPQQQNSNETEHRKIGGGSGFIFDKSGLVLTNRHVISDRDAEFTVILNNGSEFEAEVVDADDFNDIAVLRILQNEDNEKTEFPTVSLGDSQNIKVGQKVIAIGNALAEFENTVTAGVISAKGREISASDGFSSVEKLSGLIQTDAAINPGNSGGPLVNLSGEVIGINTAIASGANGIGFAIPINDAKVVIEAIKVHGKIIRPFLGVRFMNLTKEKAKELKLPVDGGALLVGDNKNGEFAVVPGSPAEKAGLKEKDIILEIDGEKITSENDLQTIISRKKVDDKITAKIWRSGEEIEVKIKLEESP